MAEFTRTTSLAVAVGSAIPYTDAVVKGCCDIRHRAGSGVVIIKGSGCCKHPTVYKVNFHGNIRGVAGPMQLGIYLDGELLPETLMSAAPASSGYVVSVDAETLVPADCGCQRISVRVITGATVTVDTASLIVEREA